MDDDTYEYRGLVAKGWDALRGDTSGFPDRSLYRDIITKNGEPALIMGCGTGRLLLEYTKDGLDTTGVDVSPEMVAICEQKAIEQSISVKVYIQAMEALNLPRKFQTIIVPSSAFQLVTDRTDADKALRAFHDHLKSQGLLIISIWHIIDDGNGE